MIVFDLFMKRKAVARKVQYSVPTKCANCGKTFGFLVRPAFYMPDMERTKLCSECYASMKNEINLVTKEKSLDSITDRLQVLKENSILTDAGYQMFEEYCAMNHDAGIEKLKDEYQDSIEKLPKGTPYYEYKTVLITNSTSIGKTDAERTELELCNLALSGWRLKEAISGNASDISSSKESKGNTLLILERQVAKE